MNCPSAMGDWGSDLEYHSAKVPSKTPVNFASTEGVGAQKEGWLVQVSRSQNDCYGSRSIHKVLKELENSKLKDPYTTLKFLFFLLQNYLSKKLDTAHFGI